MFLILLEVVLLDAVVIELELDLRNLTNPGGLSLWDDSE